MTIRAALHAAAFAALTLLLAAPGLAGAADPAAPEDQAAAVARGEALIVAGRPAEALALLRPLAEGAPDDTDAWFFRGLAAANAARLPEGRPGAPATADERRALLDEAEASYRHILDRRPGLAGARLELARTLFDRGRCLEAPDDLLAHLLGDDCDAAAHHFRRAPGGRPSGDGRRGGLALPCRRAGAQAGLRAVPHGGGARQQRQRRHRGAHLPAARSAVGVRDRRGGPCDLGGRGGCLGLGRVPPSPGPPTFRGRRRPGCVSAAACGGASTAAAASTT